MPVAIDSSRHPLVIATAHGALTDEEYLVHLEECAEATIVRDTPYAYVYDGTKIVKMAPIVAHRAQAIDWCTAQLLANGLSVPAPRKVGE